MRLPIVFVHGFIGHMNNAELRVGLEPDRLMAPDLLGYGRYKDASSQLLTVAQQAIHLGQSIERVFDSEPVVLVGHSGGAAVCVRYARSHPERVAAFVSAEGNLSPSDAFLSSRLAPMSLENVTRWLDHAQTYPHLFLAQDQVEATPIHLRRINGWLHNQHAHAVQAMARSLLVETVHPHYATAVSKVMTTLPTYLISGARSTRSLVAPPRLVAMSAGTRTISNAGHLMILEAPERFATTLSEIEESTRLARAAFSRIHR